MDDSLQGDISLPEEGVGTLLAGTTIDSSLRPLEELLEGVQGGSWDENSGEFEKVAAERGLELPVRVRIWERDLSPGTKYRLAQKRNKLEKEKPVHYKIRRQKYRRDYWKYLRPGNIARKKERTSTPLGLYKYYKDRAKLKKKEWAIEETELLEILNRLLPDGVAIHQRIFNIERIDKALGYSINNIELVDRYTRELLYTPTSREVGE